MASPAPGVGSRVSKILNMGIDALDIMFRLEKGFGIKIPRGRLY
jgi:hypothetical protein